MRGAPDDPLHRGWLFDRVHIRVADIESSRRSYRAVLRAVGREFGGEATTTS